MEKSNFPITHYDLYPGFTQREYALLSLCVQYAKANIDDLMEIADEDIEAEIAALYEKLGGDAK